VNTP